MYHINKKTGFRSANPSAFFKLLATFAIICFSIKMVQAQVLFLGGGYQLYTPSVGMNQIIDRFNVSRTLDKNMSTKAPRGLSFSLQLPAVNERFLLGIDQRGFLEFGYTILKSETSGIYQSAQTDLRMKAQVGYFSTGTLLFGERNFQGFLGARMSVGNAKISHRVGQVDAIKDLEWQETSKGVFMNFDFLLKMNITGFVVVEPYYSFSLDGVMHKVFGNEDGQGLNLYDANKAINPATYRNDDEFIPFRYRGFGLRALVGIGTPKFQ